MSTTTRLAFVSFAAILLAAAVAVIAAKYGPHFAAATYHYNRHALAMHLHGRHILAATYHYNMHYHG